jgi:glycosyltransferase involved in cell wall biosynthesis
MRIVHVLRSSETNITGLERHVLSLAAAQKARGYGVLVVTDHTGVLAEMCHRRGIPVEVMIQGFKPDGLSGGLPAEKTMHRLTSQFRAFNTDVIHCHDAQAAVQAIPAGNRAQIPAVLTVHLLEKGVLNYLRFAKGLGMSFPVICVCRSDFENLKENGMPEADIYYIPNGTATASPTRPTASSKTHQPNLILVGILQPTKGIDVAILAMAELRRRRRQLQDCPILYIYGDTSDKRYRDYYKEMSELLDLGDIIQFCGMQPGILERCDSSDILIVASRAETGPLVVLEAMSRGMPIVATDVGEVAQMLPDPRYGRIVPVNSIAALTDAIESLLSEIADGRFDPDLLIDRHRSFYTVDRMAESIDKIYREALISNPPPAT